MPRRRAGVDQTPDMFNLEDRLNTAVCVPAIRAEFKKWRDGGYQGVTATTSELLNFWFSSDHQLADGQTFKFHDAQRDAIETLIYVFEVVKVRTRTELLEKYASNVPDLRLPPHDAFARYCLKMATGSGKTLLWQCQLSGSSPTFFAVERTTQITFLYSRPTLSFSTV